MSTNGKLIAKMLIESPQNNIFKTILSLKDKKSRDEAGLFIVEGQKQVSEIPEDWNIKRLILSESYKGKTSKLESDKNLVTVSDKLFDKLSFTKTPQGIAAVVEKKIFDLSKIIKQNGFFIILENIADPGNLGTIIRSADAFGAKAVFVSNGSTDIYSDKTIRSSMGSFFHIPVINTDAFEIIKSLKNESVSVLAATLEAKQPLSQSILAKKVAVIIGNESNGLSAKIQKEADVLVKIDMPGKAESLNAAIAASIIMYEASKTVTFSNKKRLIKQELSNV